MTDLPPATVATGGVVDAHASRRPRVAAAVTDLDPTALAVTLTAGVVVLAASTLTGVSPAGLGALGMYLFGFVHFAVGYHFLALAPSTHALARRAPLHLLLASLAAFAVSLPFYGIARLAPVAYTVVFLHFAENAIYLALRRQPLGLHPSATAAVFPVLMLLACCRLGGVALRGEMATPFEAHLVATVVFLVVSALSLPAIDWTSALTFLGRHAVLVAGFAFVALFVPDLSLGWALFTYWHFASWFLYQWRARPDMRRRLAVSHVGFTAAYVVLLGLGMHGYGAPGSFLFVAVSPFAYQAQTTQHIALTLLLRRWSPAG